MECEYGAPRNLWKIPLKPGDLVKKGQYIRLEASVDYTDDQVRTACADYAPNICQTLEGIHWTYVYVSNEVEIIEGCLMEDYIIPEIPPKEKLYLLVSPAEYIWTKYKYPIILGAIVAGGAAYYFLGKKGK